MDVKLLSILCSCDYTSEYEVAMALKRYLEVMGNDWVP